MHWSWPAPTMRKCLCEPPEDSAHCGAVTSPAPLLPSVWTDSVIAVTREPSVATGVSTSSPTPAIVALATSFALQVRLAWRESASCPNRGCLPSRKITLLPLFSWEPAPGQTEAVIEVCPQPVCTARSFRGGTEHRLHTGSSLPRDCTIGA